MEITRANLAKINNVIEKWSVKLNHLERVEFICGLKATYQYREGDIKASKNCARG